MLASGLELAMINIQKKFGVINVKELPSVFTLRLHEVKCLHPPKARYETMKSVSDKL